MIKLKELLNEKTVSMGQVHSNPYATSFKSPEQIEEEQLDEKAYVDTNATFELKGFGGNDLHIKGKNLDITLSFKGKDLQNAVKSGKGKGKVVMAGVKTSD